MVQHVDAIRQMKLAIDNATKGASRSARTALQGHKRRCQTRSNMLRPNDETALAKFQADSSPPVTSAPGNAKDRQQETGRSTNNEQRPQVSKTQIAANTTSEENQQSMQNTFTRGTDASVVVSELAHDPLKYFDINQQTVVPDMDMAAVPPSVLNGARNDQSNFTDNYDSGPSTYGLSTFLANTQQSIPRGNSHTIRGSSFRSYTMDGSFPYPNGHYQPPEDATTMRGSSFTSDTMDGSVSQMPQDMDIGWLLTESTV